MNVKCKTKTIRVGVAFVLAGILLFPRQAAAQSSMKTLSMDEMLDYTLLDLKRKMQEIIDSNRLISARNQSMRKRIFFLKQQLRDYENGKIALLEEAMTLSDIIKLNSQEDRLIHKKLEDLNEYMRQLGREQKEFERRVTDIPYQSERIQNEIKALKDEVARMEQRFRPKYTTVAKRAHEQEVYKYLKLIKESRKNIDRMGKDVRKWEKQNLGPDRKKEAVGGQHQGLKRDADFVQQVLTVEQERSRALAEEAEGLRGQRKEAVVKFSLETDQWRNYGQQLQEGIERLTALKSTIHAELRTQDKELREMKSLLLSEGQSLAVQRKNVGQALDIAREWKQKVEEQLAVERDISQKQKNLAALTETQEQTSGDITGKKQEWASLREEQKRAEAELDSLHKNIDKLKRDTERFKKTGFRKEEQEMSALIQKQHNRNQQMQKEVNQGKEQLASWEKEKRVLNQENVSLKESRDTGNAEVENLKRQSRSIEASGGSFEQEKALQQRQAEENIAKLKLRAEMLSSSLVAIEAKYDADALGAGNLTQEEAQMKEYLQLLEVENKTLNDKKMTLQLTLERLQKEKEKYQ